MEEKLKRLMKHEGINSTRLAEILGIQASGISHIMSGRNKPSYDFLVKLLQRFPQINPDWLLMDKGPMYRDEIKKGATSSSPYIETAQATSSIASETPSGSNPGLFSETALNPAAIANPAVLERDDRDIIPSGSSGGEFPAHGAAGRFTPSSSIERIVVFYKDKTFSEYQPG